MKFALSDTTLQMSSLDGSILIEVNGFMYIPSFTLFPSLLAARFYFQNAKNTKIGCLIKLD